MYWYKSQHGLTCGNRERSRSYFVLILLSQSVSTGTLLVFFPTTKKNEAWTLFGATFVLGLPLPTPCDPRALRQPAFHLQSLPPPTRPQPRVHDAQGDKNGKPAQSPQGIGLPPTSLGFNTPPSRDKPRLLVLPAVPPPHPLPEPSTSPFPA